MECELEAANLRENMSLNCRNGDNIKFMFGGYHLLFSAGDNEVCMVRKKVDRIFARIMFTTF